MYKVRSKNPFQGNVREDKRGGKSKHPRTVSSFFFLLPSWSTQFEHRPRFFPPAKDSIRFSRERERERRDPPPCAHTEIGGGIELEFGASSSLADHCSERSGSPRFGEFSGEWEGGDIRVVRGYTVDSKLVFTNVRTPTINFNFLVNFHPRSITDLFFFLSVGGNSGSSPFFLLLSSLLLSFFLFLILESSLRRVLRANSTFSSV